MGGLVLRGTFPSPNITIHEMSRLVSSNHRSPYMCGWNFELLRVNSICIGADFRRFHQRFNVEFSIYPARCLAEQPHACEGDNPKNCQRFQGMIIEDQSAHDPSCSEECRQLVWDEMSYRSISGARAVRLIRDGPSPDRVLEYENVSDKTLAISHVWSQ